jgi:hypothetical protein
MPSAGFEPAIPAIKRLQTYALDHRPPVLAGDRIVAAQQPLVGQGVLIIEASRSHSAGLFWTSDQADAETSA